MNPEVIKSSIQAVIDGLTPLANKLGIAVEAIFGWAIKHNYSVAISILLLPVFTIIFGYITYKNAFKVEDWDTTKGKQDGMRIAITIIFGLLTFVMFVGTSLNLGDAIDRLVAPEWNASKDIYQLIKQ